MNDVSVLGASGASYRETSTMSSSSVEAAAPRRGTADPLAAIISLLRPQTVLSKVISGAGRWGVTYAAHEDPAFCLVLEGGCFLDLEGVAAIELEEGDFVLLPATPGFTMKSDRDVRPAPASPSQGRELRHGTKSGPPTMRMLGGNFRFDRANAALVVKMLPSIVHIKRADSGATRLARVAELIGEETGAARPGRDVILERLVEVLLVEALRFQPERAGAPEQGLLAGLSDPALARCLRRMHGDVARRWTVAELVRLAGMSRAVFAERFTRKIGMPPMQYVLEWRMAIAKDLLRRENPPLADVAQSVGYQSASAFSTAFTRLVGTSPSEFARAGRKLVLASAP